MGRFYGSMLFDDKEILHVYTYNRDDEEYIDHITSKDYGKTWDEPRLSFVKHGLRNPQITQMDGVYIAHGRTGAIDGFVLYTSEDGQNWDEGTYIGHEKGCCYYSNNIILKDKDNTNRLLIQFSEMYGRKDCVNIKHAWLKITR